MMSAVLWAQATSSYISAQRHVCHDALCLAEPLLRMNGPVKSSHAISKDSFRGGLPSDIRSLYHGMTQKSHVALLISDGHAGAAWLLNGQASVGEDSRSNEARRAPR